MYPCCLHRTLRGEGRGGGGGGGVFLQILVHFARIIMEATTNVQSLSETFNLLKASLRDLSPYNNNNNFVTAFDRNRQHLVSVRN